VSGRLAQAVCEAAGAVAGAGFFFMAKEIHIARGAERILEPGRVEQRPLEDEAIGNGFAAMGEGIAKAWKAVLSGVLNRLATWRDRAVSLLRNVRDWAARTLRQLLGLESAEDRVRRKAERQGFARGGMVRGPGGPTSDSIPAMLSAGEFVMRAKAVRKWGAKFLHALNAGQLPGYALGGLVEPLASLPSSAPRLAAAASGGGGVSGQPLVLNLPWLDPGGRFEASMGGDEAERLRHTLSRSAAARSADKPDWYR